MLPSPMRALGRRSIEKTPDELHLAVLTGRTKKIKHLLKKGVHIESVNTLGQTPLFCASFGGDYEVVTILLRLGANPNRRCGSSGAAPIHAAAFRGSRRVLRLLVEAGGDLSLRDAEFLTPRDYAIKQQSPIRRQKILEFLDLLYAMTLHRIAAATLPATSISPAGVLSEGGSNTGTLKSQKLKGFFGGSQLSLASRKHSQSTASVWSSCVSEVASNTSVDESDSNKTKEIVLTPNLHKNVSCHLLDQLCVTTSLPLLSPDQLQRPQAPTPAYTCGGPTVYSSFSWIGTPVTVRRPTPALSLSRRGNASESIDGGAPDPEAVRSLLQELSFLRRLRHPGFLEVMAACHVTHPSPDHVTLVYQHVPYGSLYHHLHVQHHDLSVGSAVDILIGLVEALLFMHAHGWFHCGVSSHALHLVSLGSAKLGGFEYAFESQVKGVGMRAEHLSKADWLRPWQAPETVLEKMVSVRTEVYSVAAIIWEVWSGMPPWCGVEEEEVKKRVGNGEILPQLKETALSLVSYLTQYGLKWNAHERELDLQEVHTMLRSLKIQCNEDERVPAVTSWGPPSIPNTPVIGRHTANHVGGSSPLSSSCCSSGELRETKREKTYEVVGIKPASHQLTRHSSSCSLASGPPSPANHRLSNAYSLLASSRKNRLATSHGSLPTSPTSKFKTQPPASRPLSVFTDRGDLLTEAVNSKAPQRRHSDMQRPRIRKPRRRQEMEFEEEFIDDEFNALLYDQPHMQLSVGSSENLLDSRLSFSIVNDSESSSQHSRRLTSSDDDDDNIPKRGLPSTPRRALKALEETGDSDNVEEEVKETRDCRRATTLDRNFVQTDLKRSPVNKQIDPSSKALTNFIDGGDNISNGIRKEETYQLTSATGSSKDQKQSSKAKDMKEFVSVSDSDSDDVFTKGNPTKDTDFLKEYEPLKSIKAMKSLEKSLSNYLPTYSIGSSESDVEDS